MKMSNLEQQVALMIDNRAVPLGKATMDAFADAAVKLYSSIPTDVISFADYPKYQLFLRNVRAFAAPASVGGHPNYDQVLSRWADVQRKLAGELSKIIHATSSDLKDEIEILSSDLSTQSALDAEWLQKDALYRKQKSGQHNRDLFRSLADLERKIFKDDKLISDSLKESIRQKETAQNNINTAAGHYGRLSKLEGIEPIHYLIPRPEEIKAALENGTYKPPEYQRFDILPSNGDMFKNTTMPVRTVVSSDIQPITHEVIAPTLQPYLDLYHFVQKKMPRETLTTSALSQLVKQQYPDTPFGPKGLGGILERMHDVFHVRCEKPNGNRLITKLNGNYVPDSIMLSMLMPQLIPNDISHVNSFYVQHTIENLLQESYIGHDGFSPLQLMDMIHSAGYPISFESLARHISQDKAPSAGLKIMKWHPLKKEERRYVLAKIRPTEKMTLLVQDALPKLGYGEICPDDLITYLSEQGHRMHPKVAKYMMASLYNRLPDVKLSKIKGKPDFYQRVDRPQTIDEITQGHTPEAGKGSLI
jgi:hypothetical protein